MWQGDGKENAAIDFDDEYAPEYPQEDPLRIPPEVEIGYEERMGVDMIVKLEEEPMIRETKPVIDKEPVVVGTNTTDRKRKITETKPVINDIDSLPKPFYGTYRNQEKYRVNFYGGAFNPYIRGDKDTKIFAAVAGTRIFLYGLPREPKVIKLGMYDTKPNFEEDYYAVAWCWVECNNTKQYKIIVGGQSGRMAVVDYPFTDERKCKFLQDCGGPINEIRVAPHHPTLVAVACKDRATRIYDIRATHCLILLAGRNVHRDQVVSVDWSADGKTLLSGGFDHRIHCWDLNVPEVKRHLKKCLEELNEYGEIRGINLYPDNISRKRAESMHNLSGYTLFVKTPVYTAKNVHYDCIDTVRYINLGPKQDQWIISKGTSHESAIYLWKFGTFGDMKELSFAGKPKRTETQIWKKNVPNGFPWFARFAVDPKKKWLVAAGHLGEMHFHDIKDLHSIEPLHTTKLNRAENMVRHIEFCNDGDTLFGVGDQGFYCRLDKPRDGQTNPKDNWKNSI